jgi:hypothetical protein
MLDPEPKAMVRVWNRLIAALEKVALKSLATGNFAWFGIFTVSGICICRLSTSDLKDLLLKVLVTYGWLGYPVASMTIFISVTILRWREKIYQQEMARISEVKNTLMQGKLELPLQSSVQQRERK